MLERAGAVELVKGIAALAPVAGYIEASQGPCVVC